MNGVVGVGEGLRDGEYPDRRDLACATATSACGARSGSTTANTLTIAPAMERAGYRAIDFTTSTHMGVAVRYKQEDPWERIRGDGGDLPHHAAAVPLDRLPLHRLGDRQPRVHGARLPHAREQRHPPLRAGRPDERRGLERRSRQAGQAQRRRTGHRARWSIRSARSTTTRTMPRPRGRWPRARTSTRSTSRTPAGC